MTDEPGAAAPVDVPAATSAPAATEQQNTTAPTDGVPAGEAAAETPEAKPEDAAAEEERKKLSRHQRQSRKISYVVGENATLKAETARLAAEVEVLKRAAPAAPSGPPKEEDFGNDYFKYQHALAKYDAQQVADSKISEFKKELLTERQQQLEKSTARELESRAAELRKSVPDFDRVLQEFVEEGGEFAPHVRDAVLKIGPELAYYIASNEDIAEELNRLDPISAAIRIGELKPKFALAQSKKSTQAPPPIRPPAGGAAPSKDLAALAKSENASEYIKARNAEEAANKR